MIWILIALAWYVSGVWGFIYWWTSEYDLEIPELLMAILWGLCGPLSWFVGWFVHSDAKYKVIIKQRKK